ncbi:MAG: hypothetical protein HYZ00_01665 [Candidatus Hydrogenedentes bacterium]|nr:hypothetical protein [Candidatus Hydrogenedentota bacterium]
MTEQLGVPHTEVDLVLVDGVSVGFTHPLKGTRILGGGMTSGG